ncbi:MAG: 3-ketoacyl-ACP reductase [Anaerolineaceae bacterium]|nr:3-ketoacyl-ACP reductase [Anaerolineaceae bacterium]
MEQRFEGRTALVTGAGGGIGAAVARRLAAEGAHVAITDISSEAAERAAADIRQSGGKASAHRLDVTSPDDIARVVAAVEAEAGLVTMAVTAAGIIKTYPFLDLPIEDWNRTLSVNLGGTYFVFQAVARRMVEENRGGSMVGIASVAGRGAQPQAVDYGASKAGVISVVRSAAVALAPHHITVNAVCPGIVDTNMTRAIHDDRARIAGISAEESLAKKLSTVPIGRLQTPDDVANVAAFLLSPDGNYVTGQSINACGGLEFD